MTVTPELFTAGDEYANDLVYHGLVTDIPPNKTSCQFSASSFQYFVPLTVACSANPLSVN
jgi:hypothetical protein